MEFESVKLKRTGSAIAGIGPERPASTQQHAPQTESRKWMVLAIGRVSQ
jgi:hypothetical protein